METADDRITEGRGGAGSARSCRRSCTSDRLERDAASISSAKQIKHASYPKTALTRFSGSFHPAEVVYEKKTDQKKPFACVAHSSTWNRDES